MSESAYVDESESDLGDGFAMYLLAAALVHETDRPSVSVAMTALRLRGQRKVHWRDENARRRGVLAMAVGSLPVQHVIVWRTSRAERSERRRRLCSTRLLGHLDQADVTEICLESRERKQNDHDLALLVALRAQRAVRPRLRMHHRPGPEEPMLWVPDVVAGAFAADRRGNDNFIGHIAGASTVYEV